MDLCRPFTEACLPLELRVIPFSFEHRMDAENVVQMDIGERTSHKPERFRIYPGSVDNRIEVASFDRTLRQLVLHVEEAERTFYTRVHKSRVEPGARIVDRVGDHFRVENKTSGADRTFLMGMDESHLFIALLPEHARTVLEAHRALEPELVTQARSHGAHVVRQGEWFFIALDPVEAAEASLFAKKTFRVQHRVGIAQALNVARIGRQHVASEVVVVRGVVGDLAERAYVRGAVTHPDHRTIVLDGWHRVVPNREELAAPVPGVDWLD